MPHIVVGRETTCHKSKDIKVGTLDRKDMALDDLALDNLAQDEGRRRHYIHMRERGNNQGK